MQKVYSEEMREKLRVNFKIEKKKTKTKPGSQWQDCAGCAKTNFTSRKKLVLK